MINLAQMLHIVLYEPEIAPNTGNIIRLAANTGAKLHLIEPLGFELESKQLRRAGLDYHDLSCVTVYKSWSDFLAKTSFSKIYALSTKAKCNYHQIEFADNDALLFGPETRGLPAEVMTELGAEQCLRIPMQDTSRSLNLSNAVAIVVYEAWRQLGFN